MKIKFLYLFILAASIVFSQEIIKKGNGVYFSKTLIVKFKQDEAAQLNVNRLTGKYLSQINVGEIKQLFPSANRLNKGNDELGRIYLVRYNSNEDPAELAAKISRQPNVEYAEPKYLHSINVVPNDSLYQAGFQANLSKISAQNAWEISKGDTNVVIAIIDSGVQWDHPDLYPNILKDASGKIVGYDFGGLDGMPDDDPREDKDPQSRSSYHGTHCAGLASAVTNNKIGIASIGYNCKILPVKTSRSDLRDAFGYPYISYGMEGIKWAADKGAKVISCSWGNFSYSRYEQDIINYATSKGSLVIAAGGNTLTSTPHYPASYKGVLSVGWSNLDDSKYANATYGREIDVASPGTFILSTYPSFDQNLNVYRSMSGSSMATPQVAGLAGLVASKFPNYTPLQIAEQIRVNADDVSAKNPDSLKYLFGKGRINAERALSNASAVSVRAADVLFIDDGNKNGLLETGETVSIQMNFINYLSPVANVNVQLECSDPSVTFGSTSFTISSLGTLGSVSNSSSKFTFTINQSAPVNHPLDILVKFTAAGYSDFQWISTRINPSYNTMDANNIALTVTSKGSLAFNDYPSNTEGDGFRFMSGDNLMFEGAFMYGISGSKVMDAAREVDFQSKDFIPVQPIKISTDASGNQSGITIFNDSGAGSNSLGIETKLSSYSFAAPPHDKYVIITAELRNKTSQDISGLYAGLFFDWDMPADDPKDTIAYDTSENFGWAHYRDLSLLNTIIGAATISSDKFGFYPVDNAASAGDVRLFDTNGFTDQEKWVMLSSGVINRSIGNADISFSVSSGPHDIPANQSVKVGFSIAAASNFDELKNAIKQSRIKYPDVPTNILKEEELPAQFILYQNYPNPFNPSTTISYSVPVVDALSHAEVQVSLKVYDVLGREIKTLVNEYQKAGKHSVKFDTGNSGLSSGVYFYRLTAGPYSETKKMLLLR